MLCTCFSVKNNLAIFLNMKLLVYLSVRKRSKRNKRFSICLRYAVSVSTTSKIVGIILEVVYEYSIINSNIMSYIIYTWYMLYLHCGEILFQIAGQNLHSECCNVLARHMFRIWATYAIISHAVAYWSMIPLTGPRLCSISLAYAKYMPDLPRFVQISSMAPA